MKYGYIRDALSNEESIIKQKDTLSELGVENFIIETSGGMELTQLLEDLRLGDTLYVTALERLTRNMNRAIEIQEILEKKGVVLYVGGSPFNAKSLLSGFFR